MSMQDACGRRRSRLFYRRHDVPGKRVRVLLGAKEIIGEAMLPVKKFEPSFESSRGR